PSVNMPSQCIGQSSEEAGLDHARRAVDQLSGDIRMSGVTRGFFDHVHEDPAQGDPALDAGLVLADLIERSGCARDLGAALPVLFVEADGVGERDRGIGVEVPVVVAFGGPGWSGHPLAAIEARLEPTVLDAAEVVD